MWNLTEKQFVDTVVNLIQENPDFIYGRPNGMCLYTPTLDEETKEEHPGCLFGQALHKLGVTEEELKVFDGNNELNDNPSIDEILPRKTKFSYSVIEWAEALQEAQDQDLTWIDCLNYHPAPELTNESE